MVRPLSLFFALFSLLVCFAAEEKPFVFASHGKAQCVIALPQNAGKFDRMAAEDLKNYLGKITGAEFRIVSAKEVKGRAVYVGPTQTAKDFKAEEWCISSPDGEKLILTGGQKIGSFYAVWALLNKLGCYAVAPDQDAVPQKKELRYDGKFERKQPAFAGRLIYDGSFALFRKVKAAPEVQQAYNLWLLRNRINGEQSKHTPSLYTYGSYHLAQPYPYHSLDLYVPPEKYFKTHPEYFTMNEFGKRIAPDRPHMGSSLCMSNPEVAQVTLQTLREYIRKDHAENPKEEWAHVYDISRLDRMPYICRCPECNKIIQEEGTELGLLMRYINTVAREIRKEYPEIIIRTFGALSDSTPPTKTLPESNVLLWIGDRFTVSDPFVPLAHPLNAESKAALEAWKGKAKQYALWDYWNLGGGKYFNPPRVETVFDALQSDFRYFRNYGISDLFIEASCDAHSPQNFMALNYFTANHLMIDPEDDPEKLADVFFQSYYGPAAPALKAWFNEIRAGIKRHPSKQASLGVGSWCYADVPFLFHSYKMLKQQAEALPVGSVYRKRVEFERITVLWSILAHKHSFQKVLKENNITAEQLVAECRALVKKYIRRFPSQKPEALDKTFEERFFSCVNNLAVPEKFKDVPEENFRMVAWPNLKNVASLQSAVTNDPDSIQGKAVKSAHKEDRYHGVDKVLPGRGRFRSTFFVLRNSRNLGGSVSLRLKKVPQDEKYHWFRLPGSIELKHKSAFWGHGWAIQADTSYLYMLTDGTASDNTWDEVWMSAKFTGPAYVKGSTKENAIWVDMLVLTRKPKK